MSEIKAAIFDLDGTLLDNNEVHFKAWKKYLKDSGMEISDEDFKENISGRIQKRKMTTIILLNIRGFLWAFFHFNLVNLHTSLMH